jgi:hypothetical protein
MICALATLGLAQTIQSIENTTDNIVTITISSTNPGVTAWITGAPYSADQLGEHSETLADGTHLTDNRLLGRFFRDSQGRVRVEHPIRFTRGKDDGPMLAIIKDVPASMGYVLDDQNKIAHRIQLKPAHAHTTAQAGPDASNRLTVPTRIAPSDPSKPEIMGEDLGDRVIEGVVARGHRTTTVWPVGSQGNDRPITDIQENWNSAELSMMVLAKNTFARHGEQVTRLVNIRRAEPEPTLFQAPAGYTIVDDKDSFKITIKRQ